MDFIFYLMSVHTWIYGVLDFIPKLANITKHFDVAKLPV